MGASGTPHLKMVDLVHDYMSEQFWAESTVRSATGTLEKKFAAWWDNTQPKGPKSITHLDVKGFLVGPQGIKHTLATASFNQAYYTLRAFINWGVESNYFKAGTWKNLKNLPRVEPSDKLRLTPDQMDAMMDRADPYERWVIALLRYTAARMKEVLRLKVGDLTIGDPNTGSRIRIFRSKAKRSEGQKYYDDFQMLPDLVAEWRDWEEHYVGMIGRPLRNSDPLIPRRPGRRPSPSRPWETGTIKTDAPSKSVYSMIKKHLLAMFPDMDLTGSGTHTLRRSAARAMYFALKARGVRNPITVVQAMLDHQTEQQTWDYIGVDARREERNDAFRDFGTLRPHQGLHVVGDVGDAAPTEEVG